MDTITKIERVAVTRLRRVAADLLNRVCYGGERFIVTSSGKERAALVSIDDLEVLLSLEVKYVDRLLALEQEEGKPQKIAARWLDRHHEENTTWEKTYLKLVGSGGLLEQLGIMAALPPGGSDMERLLALPQDEGLGTTPVPLLYESVAVRAKSPRPPTTHKPREIVGCRVDDVSDMDRLLALERDEATQQ